MVEQQAPWRKISKDKYIIAGVITFLIFTSGLMLGIILEEQRYDLVEEVTREQEVGYASLQLQYLYLTSFTDQGNNCPILDTTLKTTIADLSDSLGEVVRYEEDEDTPDERKALVQRRYLLDNLRYWLLAKESKDKCDIDLLPILYFYTEDCPSCPNQGTILSHFKDIFGDKLLVFPINLDLREKEPMVEIMINQFKITKYPSMVIENQRYEGVVKQEQMQEIICSNLHKSPECIQNE